MIKQYDMEQSPLYRLRNKRKLEKLLRLPEGYFRNRHTYKYNEFFQNKKDGSKRKINNPEEHLKKIQKRIFELLNRIEKPSWIVSGQSGKSYVDNAKIHQFNEYICTMDIEKFYESTREIHVYNFFRYNMNMSEDVATILTKLVTYEGRIPTGTPTSQLMAFWTYEDLFINIYNVCLKHNIEFSLYVDDITLSSKNVINKRIKQKVKNILKQKNLSLKKNKTKFYTKESNKKVTGVIINDKGELRLKNSNRKKIIELYKECLKEETCTREKLLRLNGMINNANQVERGIFPSIQDFLRKNKRKINEYNANQIQKKKYKQVIKK